MFDGARLSYRKYLRLILSGDFAKTGVKYYQ
jgi:hypothetical protein